ncbi:MauE/DoxX family redox-associated membrane protein [Microbacterium sp. NPDC058342]|uniref:MauE/DoxX family redox-associated membrane protein n=1 Tax=Microbacterium sp. NPDC058342 TaxID=3346454 RepID=UPI003648BB4C
MSDSLYALALTCLIGVLAASGMLKLTSPAATRTGFNVVGMPASMQRPLFVLGVPVAELVLATALVLAPAPGSIMVSALCTTLFIAFLAVVLRALLRGAVGACGCFGRLDRSSIGPATVVRNAGLIALSVLVLTESSRGSLFQALGALGTQAPIYQTGLLVLGVVAVLTTMGTLQSSALPSNACEQQADRDSTTGAELGVHILHDLFGVGHDVRNWFGAERSLLVFVSAGCAACHALADDIVDAIPDLESKGIRLRVITDVEARNAISSFPALGAHIYHDREGALGAEALVRTFPSAILVDGGESARFESGPAVGAEAIHRLMRQAQARLTA